MFLRSLGKNPPLTEQKKFENSSHFKNGTFHNIEETPMTIKSASMLKILWKFIMPQEHVSPSKPLPTIKSDLKNMQDEIPQIVWFGHSSYLISHKGYKVFVDPVLFGNASPVFFTGRPFAGTNIYNIGEIPEIDLLILTHDHYDHMSYKTLMKLKSKIKKIVCSLGVKTTLVYWGFDSSITTELDWYQDVKISEQVSMIALPARHFSGRTFVRNKTVWNAYALKLHEYKFFIGGDSGYDEQFKKIGEEHGPFDMAFVECGQYGKAWPYIHMFPEQTAQVGTDLKTKILMPVHWGKFILSIHPWNEPVKRLLAAAVDREYKVVTSKIGEVYSLGNDSNEQWWNSE